jgi:hypothetical protein
MYLRLAEFLSQKAWVLKSQYPQITKMQIPPPKKTKIGYANHICRRSVNLTNYFLKVSTNEIRDGLKVVAFDRSPFKLFSLGFSKKSVQAPSCRRSKTT